MIETLLSMGGRTVATGGGPGWEFLIPAGAILSGLLLGRVFGGVAGFVRVVREARERHVRLQAAVDEAFDELARREALGRAAAASRREREVRR